MLHFYLVTVIIWFIILIATTKMAKPIMRNKGIDYSMVYDSYFNWNKWKANGWMVFKKQRRIGRKEKTWNLCVIFL